MRLCSSRCSRPALQRAGALADGWLASPAATGEVLSTETGIYRQAALAAGRRPLLTLTAPKRPGRYVLFVEARGHADRTTVLVRKRTR